MEGCGTIQGHIKMALVTLFWPIVLLYMFLHYTYNYIGHKNVHDGVSKIKEDKGG